MGKRVAKLFVIDHRIEAGLPIYALVMGITARAQPLSRRISEFDWPVFSSLLHGCGVSLGGAGFWLEHRNASPSDGRSNSSNAGATGIGLLPKLGHERE